jgi:hypothetical protein
MECLGNGGDRGNHVLSWGSLSLLQHPESRLVSMLDQKVEGNSPARQN